MDHEPAVHEHTEHTHAPHTSHEVHGSTGASWAMAAQATLHCLTGCAVGEVLGMVLGTAFGWGNLPTTLLAIVLAFAFGYALTMRGVRKAGVDLRTALRVALAADTVSIAVMELIDNGTILVWPAAMDAQLTDTLFWISLAVSLVLAFVVHAGQPVDDRPGQGARGGAPLPPLAAQSSGPSPGPSW